MRARGVVLLTVLVAGACSRDGEQREPYVDLVAAFAAASTNVETGTVVFGSQAARHHLVSGWAGDELDAKREQTFVWSTGARSVLRFERLEPRELHVTLKCRPWRSPDDNPQTLAVELNGDRLETLRLARGLHEYEIALPASSVRVGENLLAFEYGTIRVDPDEGGERDRRSLGVAWYRIDLGGGPASQAVPAADAKREQIFLPYGSELAFVTYLRPQTLLAASGVDFRGSAGSALVLLETDEGGTTEIARLEDSGEVSVALEPPGPNEPGGRLPARLLLRALAADAAQPDGGLVLSSPRLEAPALAAVSSPTVAVERAAQAPPNIIFYLIDTLRSDRLGAYGYERPISPNLDAFAGTAVLFENGIGQSSWTRASIASMFTGMWPGAHGAVGRRDKLAPEAATLAEALQAGGYHTTAFITNPNVERTFGFSQGFDDFIHVRKGTASDRVNERVFRWLDGYEGEKPFFLYIHTVDPHDPYLPPEEFRERWAADSEAFAERVRAHRRKQTWEPTPEVLENLNALYDAEIAFNDHSFGALVAQLRERGLFDDSLVLVISDHGEEFYDHGRWTHGKSLYDETLAFPMMVKFPGQSEGVRTGRPVQHIDVMPSLLDAAGLATPPSVEGSSFAGWARQPTATTSSAGPVFSHLHLDGPLYLSVVDDGWKLIQRRAHREPVRSTLFNLREDPLESKDRLADFPVRGALLDLLIEGKLRSRDHALTTEEAVLDPELEESLRALGYLQ